MAFCPNCGASAEENAKFCPDCGTAMPQAAAPAYTAQPAQPAQPPQTAAQPIQAKLEGTFQKLNDTADDTASYDQADIQNNKLMGILSYLSILVLIPLFTAKDSRYARFHVNQGLTLFIVEILWTVVYRIIRWILPYGFLYRLVGLIGSLVSLVFLLMAIIGIINVVNGKAKELPVIGKFRLLK